MLGLSRGRLCRTGDSRRGERIELRGFGTFRAVERAPRTARNPRTDETVHVPRRMSPVFKPAQEFRRLVEAENPLKPVKTDA